MKLFTTSVSLIILIFCSTVYANVENIEAKIEDHPIVDFLNDTVKICYDNDIEVMKDKVSNYFRLGSWDYGGRQAEYFTHLILYWHKNLQHDVNLITSSVLEKLSYDFFFMSLSDLEYCMNNYYNPEFKCIELISKYWGIPNEITASFLEMNPSEIKLKMTNYLRL
ncbi:MAG: hypothetical protein KDD50_00635 [Bdellovibrionales bacterium]|nr:hypothetical protein [Bdellovibrionales bacterium]MCB0412807.1 hypothetical protein [Bdellovibrionales bacterium]